VDSCARTRPRTTTSTAIITNAATYQSFNVRPMRLIDIGAVMPITRAPAIACRRAGMATGANSSNVSCTKANQATPVGRASATAIQRGRTSAANSA